MSGWDCAPDLLSDAQEPQLQGSLLAYAEVGRSHSEPLDDRHPFPGHTHSSIPSPGTQRAGFWLLLGLAFLLRLGCPRPSPHASHSRSHPG